MSFFERLGASIARKTVARVVPQVVEKTVKDYVASAIFVEKLDSVIMKVLKEPQNRWFWFIKDMQARMQEVDKAMTGKDAWNVSAAALRSFLHEEKIKFGDERYAWDRDAARALAQSYEIDHWESLP